jgi:DNA replication and repair protein RecF
VSWREVKAWDQELVSAGSIVDVARREYMRELLPHFAALSAELLSEPAVLTFQSGWPEGSTLEEALQLAEGRDQRVRFSSVGPHRADLRFKYAGQSARDRVSRGEQKMLAITLILSQIQCLAAGAQRETCLLVDDPAAELDVDNLGKLLGALARLPCQLVVTAVKRDAIDGLPFGRTFHVKQGQFNPVL